MGRVEVVELGKRLSIELYGDYANGFVGVVRSSTWDLELRKIERTSATETSSGQPYVVYVLCPFDLQHLKDTNQSRFGWTRGTDGLLDAVGRAGHTATNLPTGFLESLPKDLNGSFEYRNDPPTDCGSDTAST